MTFEGPEKKLEIETGPGAPSLRSLGLSFWRGVVSLAGAEILSRISSPACDAYLLSESSLFVLDRRMTLITCGRTTLVDAAIEVMRGIPAGSIRGLLFERRSEHFPELQPTTFEQDADRLRRMLPGRTVSLGDASGDHVDLFLSGERDSSLFHRRGLELHMRELSPESRRLFTSGFDARGIRSELRFESFFPGLIVDEHEFQPFGYSLNGLAGEQWCSLHVTPEEQGSYASFECGLAVDASTAHALTENLLRIFRPERAFILMQGSEYALDTAMHTAR